MNQNLYLLVVSIFFLGIVVNVNYAQITSGKYNVATASKLLTFSAISSCSVQAINNWDCSGCDPSFGDNVEVFPNVAQNNYVIDNNVDTIVIASQGTSNLVAWINNLRADLKSVNWCNGCEIHNGFYDLFYLIFPQISKSVTERLNRIPGSRIFAIGHSLGGAMATLIAYNLVRTNLVPASSVTVYKYGQPRTGNTAFATAFNKLLPNSWRIVNHADVVPHIPPAFLTDYYSTGTLVYCPISASKICTLKPNAEDDGSWTHFSVTDHLTYFGLQNSNYNSDEDSNGCKNSTYNPPQFIQAEQKILNLIEQYEIVPSGVSFSPKF